MPVPKLLNAKENRAGLYVGRAYDGLQESPFLNPFSVGQDTHENRVEAVWRHLRWFLQQPQRLRLDEIEAAPAIVCWCAPGLCHGHNLQWCVEARQFHREPCPNCNQMGVQSILNGFDYLDAAERFLVYENGQCPSCRHYRFRHHGHVTRETVPFWAAGRELEEESTP